MIIVSYDFANDRVRNRFSKFLKKFGHKIQYSVYEIKNSQRVLQNIISEIELIYRKRFSDSDSILIYQLCEGCKRKVKKYGYASHDDEDIVIFK